jgi:subfamily B ATP-binding cassette protein MsbA
MTRAETDPKNTRKAKPESIALRVARRYLRPYRLQLAGAGLAALIVAGSTSAIAWILGPAINALFQGHDHRALILMPLALIVCSLVRGAAQILQSWTVNGVGHRIVGRIQVELFGKIIRSDLARLRASHTGDFVSAMLYDATLVRNAATTGLIGLTQNAVMVAGLLAVMLHRDLVLTLAIFLVGPLVGVLMGRFTRWSKAAARGAMNETSGLSTAIMEGIDGVKVVKIDNREAFEEGRVAVAVERRQAHVIQGANIGAASAPVVEMVMSFVLAGVIAYAGWQAGRGRMSVGDFTSFLASFLMASQSLRQLANLPPVFSEGLTAAERLFASMDIRAEVADAPDAAILTEPPQAIRFDHVSFAYGEAAPALEDVSLQAKRGETIALVGPSGGGKSTILNLIPRFYDVTAGVVSLDGRDVRGLTLASLRHQIALVTQEPFLFDDTIRANIAYPRPEASQAEVEAAARQAAAHDFILDLPKGYDTQVGEAGARLSGGQRQRIAIARAFLKNAPILLLDEATSALDTESEAQVQAALERLMAGRTTLLIAHRLSTVKGADRIYVIDRGRVVETGAHAELLRAKGLYARLAQAQNLEPAAEVAAQ